MRIAICDDGDNDRKILRHMLDLFADQKGVALQITEYTDGVDLLDENPQILSEIDLLFLDIYMECSNGFDVAKALRASGMTSLIIFLTTSPDFAVASYEVEALSYLLKPIQKEKFILSMERSMQTYRPRSIFLAGRLFVQDHIVFAESNLKNITLYFRDGTSTKVREKLGTVAAQLTGSAFLRCHQSYLVNLRYVRCIENETFITTLEIPVLIRKRDFPEMRKRYYDYLKSVAGMGGRL